MPALTTASPLVTGAAIASSIGARNAAPESAANCYKLTTHDSWGSASQTDYTYLYLWDANRQLVFSVLDDIYTTSFACTGTVAHAFKACPDADAAMWAQVAAQVKEARETRDRQDQEVRDYIQHLRAHKGQQVIAVKGRKMAKGSKGTIERVHDGQFGPCALIDGQWIALDNLTPDVAAPEGEHLTYYYENCKQFFLKR